jgi:hypothetical protein
MLMITLVIESGNKVYMYGEFTTLPCCGSSRDFSNDGLTLWSTFRWPDVAKEWHQRMFHPIRMIVLGNVTDTQ